MLTYTVKLGDLKFARSISLESKSIILISNDIEIVFIVNIMKYIMMMSIFEKKKKLINMRFIIISNEISDK